MNWLFQILCLIQPVDANYLESLYARQDPKSLAKQLYFYSQHPETPQGLLAKKKILELLKLDTIDPVCPLHIDSAIFEQLLKALFKKDSSSISLSEEAKAFLSSITMHQKHRMLKGHDAKTIQELESLDVKDVDVGRGMFLLAFENDLEKVKLYEAVLDFMALCIQARLLPNASNEDLVHEMNHFIFHELGYRFPAYSEHENKIDSYTFLPSVLDSRQGVCLGVSLLYYSLAQRLGLDLTIYTPPGHIFLSLHENLNIETTARGIHMPLSRYLSLHIKSLKKRNQKELLGLALFNQASVYLKKEDYATSAKLYEKALKFIPDDAQILELLASCYFMNKNMWLAQKTFSKVKTVHERNYLSSNFVIEDYFKGSLTPEGLKVVFQDIDPQMQSLLEQAKKLESVHKKHKESLAILHQLGITYLQLRQYEKAFQAFETLYPKASQDPVVLYYLTELSIMRYNRDKTLFYAKRFREVCNKLDYMPQAAKRLFDEIDELWPTK